MGFDSKCDSTPATILLGLHLCPWTWGIFSRLLQHCTAATSVPKSLAGDSLPLEVGYLLTLTVRKGKKTALVELSCKNNQLRELDVSKSTELEELYCDANQLSKLNRQNKSTEEM